MIIDFKHIQSSHCENGTICSLLANSGFEISEPMVFGIGSGLFFAHMPFVKNQNIPLTSYRIYPGRIYRNATRRLGIVMYREKFKDKNLAMKRLDETLEKGISVGLLTNLYYLPYFPKSYRFHYNAHNTIVYGKEGDEYLVSDPVLEDVSTIKYDDLLKARFAKGLLKVKGDLYYPVDIPENIDLEKATVKGIKRTVFAMVTNPFIPYHGVRGIHYLAKAIPRWKRKYNSEKFKLIIGNIIRMLEEAGTGGAGFRFMYAAFLQESAEVLNKDWLKREASEMTEAGQKWREFAYLSARIIKEREKSENAYMVLSEVLMEIAEIESNVFNSLKELK